MTAYRKAVDLGHLRAGSALGYWYLNVPPTDLAQGVACCSTRLPLATPPRFIRSEWSI